MCIMMILKVIQLQWSIYLLITITTKMAQSLAKLGGKGRGHSRQNFYCDTEQCFYEEK